MQKLIDNSKAMRQWNDDMKKVREGMQPMATKLSPFQQFVCRVIARARKGSAHSRAIFQNRNVAQRDE